MTDEPLDSGHAVEFLERVYALQQIIEAIIDSHPMATHNDAIKIAIEALNDATVELYRRAGEALMDLEDAETETP